MTSPVDRDAAEFGTYIKSGGWRLGLLVARNVQPGSGQGRRSTSVGTQQKLSVIEFAARAGVSRERVGRFFDAWEKAAESGVVPRAADLNPDVAVDLPDDETTPWNDFYSSGRTTVGVIGSNKKALAQAIASDPEVAAAAAEAVTATASAATKREAFKRLAADPEVAGHDRTRFEAEVAMNTTEPEGRHDRREAVQNSKNTVAKSLGYTDALLGMDQIVGISKRIGEYWTRGAVAWSDDQRVEFRERWVETLHELDMRGQAFAPDLDAELADLLDGGR